MDLFLNELSFNPVAKDKYEAREIMQVFSKAVAESIKNGFRNIKSDMYPHDLLLTDDYTLKDWLIDKEVRQELKTQLFGYIIPPFIKEDDEQVFSDFVGQKFYYEDAIGSNYNCIGMAAAYLYDSLTISLCTSRNWQQSTLPLTIESEVHKKVEDIYNIYDEQSYKSQNVVDYFESITPVVLLDTTIKPEDKEFTLFGDHHGKAELKKLGSKLIKSKYVEEIRSTEFGGSSFIRKVHSDGVIEIVYLQSDRRYALWVQTTGRNYRETKLIADKLRERYS